MKKISGTMIAGILGISKYETPLDVWLKAKGLKVVEQNERMSIGLYLEPLLIDLYEKLFNVKLSRQVYLETDKYCGHIDGLSDTEVVEIKTTQQMLEVVPVEWYCQVQWYLMLSQRQVGRILAVKIPEYSLEQIKNLLTKVSLKDIVLDTRLYTIDRDDNWLAHAREVVDEFIKTLQDDEPPEVFGKADPSIIYRIATPESIEATPDILSIYKAYIETKNLIKSLEDELNSYAMAIKEYMKDKEFLLHQGKVITSWKTRERECVDSVKLKEAGIYDKYVKKTVYREFSVKSLKE